MNRDDSQSEISAKQVLCECIVSCLIATIVLFPLLMFHISTSTLSVQAISVTWSVVSASVYFTSFPSRILQRDLTGEVLIIATGGVMWYILSILFPTISNDSTTGLLIYFGLLTILLSYTSEDTYIRKES